MMFTGLEPVTPSEQAKEEVLQLFRTGEAPPEYRQKMETLVDRARHIPKENLPVIRSRAVAARCRAARPGAEPGPSQVRVTHLKAELLVDGGAEILTAWARLWQRAELSAEIVALWTHAAAPFRKPSGGIRPVGLCEVDLKLATGALLDASTAQLLEALGPANFGCQVPAGAETEVFAIACATRAEPEDAIISWDGETAFGMADRAYALEVALDQCPAVAPCIACMAQAPSFDFFVQVALGVWVAFAIWNGLLQGETLSNATFGLLMLRVIQRTLQDLHAENQPWSAFVRFAVFVDDLLTKSPVVAAATLKACLRVRLLEAGVNLRDDKCKSHVPAWSWAPPEEAMRAQLAEVAQISDEGLEILGGAIEGDFEAFLGPFAFGTGPARKRLEKAERFVEAAVEMAATPLKVPSRQPAWLLLSKVAAHSLDYDARLLTHGSFLPLAQRLDECLLNAAGRVLGSEAVAWPSVARRRCLLPTAQSGGGMQSAIRQAKSAHLAAAAQCFPPALEAAARMAPGADRAHLKAVMPQQGVAECIAALQSVEVFVDKLGVPAREAPSHSLNPVELASPIYHLQRIVQRVLCEEERETILGDGATTAGTRRLVRCCSGVGAGDFMMAAPDSPETRFQDVDFSLAVLWRLGALTNPSGATCRHQKADEEVCAEVLDLDHVHALTCKCGPGVDRVHNNIADTLARQAIEAGCRSRREVHIPEVAKWSRGRNGVLRCIDAYLDVRVSGGYEMQDDLWDVTVRHPGAQVVAERAANTDGVAAAEGEKAKQARYPPSRGRAVRAFAIEGGGRIGAEGHQIWADLAREAAWRDGLRGYPARRRVQRWRAAVSATLAKGLAQTLHEAIHGETGRPASKAPQVLNHAAPTGQSAAVRSRADAVARALERQQRRPSRA